METKVSFRKHLGKGRILRAARLAELGGFGFIRGKWVDWTFFFFFNGNFDVCQRVGCHCELLLTITDFKYGIMQTIGFIVWLWLIS